MDPLDLPTLAAYAGGTLRGGDPAARVREVSTDSRSVGPGELFLALRGERFDGHGYVSQVAARGAVGAVVARDHLAAADDVPADFAWIEVADTLAAYQEIAARYRRVQLDALRVVGITGSNGKTSTKDFLAAVLGDNGGGGLRVLKTEGNLNNHVGVPRMVLRASAAVHDVAVLEMGMNHPGEIAPLARIARPDVGIITNVGTAHLEFMGTREAIAREKGMLAEALGPDGTLVLPAEDDFAASIAARTAATVVTVGLHAGDLRAEQVRSDAAAANGGTRFTVVDARDGERADVSLPVPGMHMVVNALLALAAGRALGVPLAAGAAGLATVRLTGGRLERKTVHGLTFLDDSYNANPDSMAAALRTLAALPVPPGARRLAVLGRMGELGDAAAAGYRRVGETVAAEGLDALLTVGPEAGAIGDAARASGLRGGSTHAVNTTAEAARLLRSLARPGDLILLKGSRSAALETVLPALDPAGSSSGGLMAAAAVVPAGAH